MLCPVRTKFNGPTSTVTLSIDRVPEHQRVAAQEYLDKLATLLVPSLPALELGMAEAMLHGSSAVRIGVERGELSAENVTMT